MEYIHKVNGHKAFMQKINIFLMQKPRETTMKKMSITTKNIHPYEESCKH